MSESVSEWVTGKQLASFTAIKFTKRYGVSEWVSELVSDKQNQWSDYIIAQLNDSKRKYEVLQTFVASSTKTNKFVGRLIHSLNNPGDS